MTNQIAGSDPSPYFATRAVGATTSGLRRHLRSAAALSGLAGIIATGCFASASAAGLVQPSATIALQPSDAAPGVSVSDALIRAEAMAQANGYVLTLSNPADRAAPETIDFGGLGGSVSGTSASRADGIVNVAPSYIGGGATPVLLPPQSVTTLVVSGPGTEDPNGVNSASIDPNAATAAVQNFAPAAPAPGADWSSNTAVEAAISAAQGRAMATVGSDPAADAPAGPSEWTAFEAAMAARGAAPAAPVTIDVPEVAAAAPSIPAVPAIPATPAVPALPAVPAVPATPALPAMPALPSFSTGPGIAAPSARVSPDEPTVPPITVPAIPAPAVTEIGVGAWGTPSPSPSAAITATPAAGTGAVPAVRLPGLPSLPDLPLGRSGPFQHLWSQLAQLDTTHGVSGSALAQLTATPAALPGLAGTPLPEMGPALPPSLPATAGAPAPSWAGIHVSAPLAIGHRGVDAAPASTSVTSALVASLLHRAISATPGDPAVHANGVHPVLSPAAAANRHTSGPATSTPHMTVPAHAVPTATIAPALGAVNGIAGHVGTGIAPLRAHRAPSAPAPSLTAAHAVPSPVRHTSPVPAHAVAAATEHSPRAVRPMPRGALESASRSVGATAARVVPNSHRIRGELSPSVTFSENRSGHTPATPRSHSNSVLGHSAPLLASKTHPATRAVVPSADHRTRNSATRKTAGMGAAPALTGQPSAPSDSHALGAVNNASANADDSGSPVATYAAIGLALFGAVCLVLGRRRRTVPGILPALGGVQNGF